MVALKDPPTAPAQKPGNAKPDPNPARPLHPPVRRIAIWGPMLVVLALALLLIFGIWRHVQQKRAQHDFAQQIGKTAVEFVEVKRDQKPHDLMLPGNITAILETTIYARANGYVAKWLVDIGDNVKTGQPLAELETPELDQQLAGAQNTLKQNQANFELARVTAQRWQELANKQVVAKQENDERQGNYQASAAGVKASQAEVQRLTELQKFKHVTAPFDGKITSRKIDIGSLVSEGSGTAGTVLFTLAQTDPLRVFVDVPQADAPLIEVGSEVKVLVNERANRDFTGKVTRTAGAIDPTSRTMRVEVQVPNHDGALFAGMYATVKFTLHDQASPIIIPSNVFVFRSNGTQVATVTKDNKIHWQPVEVGRDFGTYMEVLKGLDENTHVVVNPTDDLTEGLEVEPKAQEAEKK
jgi:RND family efflux transporter MFP subunit